VKAERSILVKIAEKRRARGICGLAALVADNCNRAIRRFFDARFDRRFKMETTEETDLDDLAIESLNKRFGVRYEPTPVATFRRMMSYLPRDLGQFVFIDLGCGKGRMLAAATQYGFRRIIGVEFSAELCVIAEKNMLAVRSRTGADIRVVNVDAADFQIPDGDCVIYIYNPFDSPVLNRVADNIRACQTQAPRRIYVIYYNAVHGAMLADRLDFMRLIGEGRWWFDPAARRAKLFAIFAGEPGIDN